MEPCSYWLSVNCANDFVTRWGPLATCCWGYAGAGDRVLEALWRGLMHRIIITRNDLLNYLKLKKYYVCGDFKIILAIRFH